MYLIGSLLQSIFTLACGLSRTSYQLILFRGLAGIAISLCLPSAVSIITNSFPEGKHRNIAFASMGGAQPIGFSIGLTLGGVFADTIGWRYGFYVAAILNTIVFVLAVWGLPRTDEVNGAVTWSRIRTEIDWVGATIASVSLAVLSYVLASVFLCLLHQLWPLRRHKFRYAYNTIGSRWTSGNLLSHIARSSSTSNSD